MAIKIIKPGMFTTLQDLGRNGYRCDGIGPGGAMDFFAASVANILTGNDENYPVVEMHFPAAEFLFEEDTLVSITGADFSPSIDGIEAALWKPVLIKQQQRLCFKKYRNGARAYLSVQGGIKADKWLNSYSTHTKLRLGGHKGRPLLKGDDLRLYSNPPLLSFENLTGIAGLTPPVYEPANNIRFIAGPEWHKMDDLSKAKFSCESFAITARSDRMGYRMQGVKLSMKDTVQLISSPVDSGTVQLLPNGQLIILMADHQTTGGYPRIANVIGADMPKLAQQPVHGKLQFEMVSIENAEDHLVSLYRSLESIKNHCKNYYEAYRHQL